jgi:hypothetical protein
LKLTLFSGSAFLFICFFIHLNSFESHISCDMSLVGSHVTLLSSCISCDGCGGLHGNWVQACEMDEGSVEKLMQRAHLYESMEKYKLSVADLKKVLKLEPTHRMATLTLNRLRKMLD